MNTADTGQTLGQSAYGYDGDGRRVKKLTGTGSSETVFVYDAAGRMIAEYASAPAQQNGTQYLTQDNLGTPRVIAALRAS
jgi:YD repeat-containing protein